MSSIQKFPVEILLDVFHANDPAGTEALRLTCRRFSSIILDKVDVLQTRFFCDLVYGPQEVRLYRAPANNESTRDEFGRETRQPIASGSASPHGLQHMYQMFGCKTAIRQVEVSTAPGRDHLPDAPLMQLLAHFPSVKGAVYLYIGYVSVLPTDAVLDRFERLETIVMDTSIPDENRTFWSVLFASKTFRRLPNVIIDNNSCYEYPEVDAGEMFDFITDCSLLPAGKPRVVSVLLLDDDSLDALERRFYENIASIGGQVCAIITDHEYDDHYLTNMAFGSRQETLAKQLEHDAFGA